MWVEGAGVGVGKSGGGVGSRRAEGAGQGKQGRGALPCRECAHGRPGAPGCCCCCCMRTWPEREVPAARKVTGTWCLLARGRMRRISSSVCTCSRQAGGREQREKIVTTKHQQQHQAIRPNAGRLRACNGQDAAMVMAGMLLEGHQATWLHPGGGIPVALPRGAIEGPARRTP